MQLLKNKFKNFEIHAILISFVVAITVLMMMHDYLASVLFNQSYYLSESLLFKITIVLLIIPIIYLRHTNSIKFLKEINVTKIILYLIPIVIIHILIASWLIALISQAYMEEPFTFEFLIKHKFNQDFIFLLTVYGMMYLIARYHSLNIQPQKNMPIKNLSIKQGKNTEVISVDEIEWIAAETPYVGIWINNKKHLYNSTLAKILAELNNDTFVQIHRSTIVNISKIGKIVSRENGDYDIYLYDNTLLRLSRNYRNNLKHSQLKF